MRQAIRQHHIVIYAISLGLMTISVSLFQPIPAASAQQLTSPVIGLSPTHLAFTAHQGGGNPAAQTLTINNTAGGTVRWGVSHDAAWLWHTPGTGTGTGAVTIGATPGALTAGTYTAHVTLWPTGAPSVTVPVTLTVTPTASSQQPRSPVIGLSPASLAFTAQQGSSNPPAQTLTIHNTAGGTVRWAISHDAAWLWHTPGTGTGTGTVTIGATPGALTVGTYTAHVTLWPTGAPSVTVPVTLTVTPTASSQQPRSPAIGLSPASLAFTAHQGSSNPPAQTLAITNKGGGTLSWAVSDTTPWIAPAPSAGTGNGLATISVTTGSLKAGTYTGAVTLSATGASAVTVPVTFTVTPTAGTASTTVNLSPSSLNYAATQGAANPANQNISLTNTDGTLNWTVSDDASWLTVSPASGSGSRTLTTSVNTAGLTTGTYNGTLTVSAAGTSSKTVAVTLIVNAPATSSATLKWSPNTESDLAGYKIYRATTSGGYGAPFATVTGDVTTYIASGLQVGTTYFFVITAFDSAGNESPFSNEATKSIF